MHFYFIAACFLLTVHGYKYPMYFEDGGYNPCNSVPGKYYYPDPSNPNQYYQCDASGIAYHQSCAGSLVWDDSALTCNWPSAVAPSSPTTTTPEPDSDTPPPDQDTPPTDQMTPWTPPAPTDSTTPGSSYCDPNPCGAHGQCFPTTKPTKFKFVCVCSGNWYGRLCDKYMNDVVNVKAMKTYQMKNMYQPMNYFQSNTNLRKILYQQIKNEQCINQSKWTE